MNINGLTFEITEDTDSHFVDGRKVAQTTDFDVTDVEITDEAEFFTFLIDEDHASVEGVETDEDFSKVSFTQAELKDFAFDMAEKAGFEG